MSMNLQHALMFVNHGNNDILLHKENLLYLWTLRSDNLVLIHLKLFQIIPSAGRSLTKFPPSVYIFWNTLS